MYPQNNNTGGLEVLETKTFFAAQPWWTDIKNFCKIHSADLTLVASLQGYRKKVKII